MSTIYFIFMQTHFEASAKFHPWGCVTIIMIALSHAFFHGVRSEVQSTVPTELGTAETFVLIFKQLPHCIYIIV